MKARLSGITNCTKSIIEIKEVMFIFIDGIDGAGKSTLIRSLHESLGSGRDTCEVIKFPSRNPTPRERVTPLARTLFFLKDFEETMHRAPASMYNPEAAFIFDRTFISTMAYQGFNKNGVGGNSFNSAHPRFDAIFSLGAEALLRGSALHDIYFVHLRCDPEVAATRILGRGDNTGDEIDAIKDKDALVDRLSILEDRINLSYAHVRLNMKRLDVQSYTKNYHFITLDSTHVDTATLVEDMGILLAKG